MAVSERAKQAAAQAVQQMGGPVATARKLGLGNYQTVQSWLEAGVPARYCPRLESDSGVSRKDLRPDDWADYWPEATEAKAA